MPFAPAAEGRAAQARRGARATTPRPSSRAPPRDAEHPLRRRVARRASRRFAERLAAGDRGRARAGRAPARGAAREPRGAVRSCATAGAAARQLEARARRPAERASSELIDRQLRAGIVELLDDAGAPRRPSTAGCATTADDLLRRHHHQIGLTVRENLEALDTGTLVEHDRGARRRRPAVHPPERRGGGRPGRRSRWRRSTGWWGRAPAQAARASAARHRSSAAGISSRTRSMRAVRSSPGWRAIGAPMYTRTRTPQGTGR